jgi:pimeloyl-ACP methyl ester carboxylesterase
MFLAPRLALSLLLLLPTAVGAEDGTFISGGVKIHYRVQGQGEPVVLIHGFSDWIENTWEVPIGTEPGLMDVLSRRYQVIALDCRGHGKSGKPHGKQYGQEMVRDVIRLLDHRHLRQAHLIGYSMGAFIAGNVLLRYPDRLRSAILGGGAPFTVSDYRKAVWFRDVVQQTADGLVQGKGFDPIIRFLTPPNEPPPTEQQIAEINRAQLAGQDRQALAAVLRQWAEWSVDDRRLAANRVPVLAVVGSLDPLKRTVEPLRGRLARLEIREIVGANHMNTPAQPAFLQAVEEFLARKPEPGEAAPSGSAKHKAPMPGLSGSPLGQLPRFVLCALRSEPERSDKRPDHR